MSLDVTLYEVRKTEVFDFNITHNLNTMAEAAGIYKAIWRPEELGIETAGELIPILEAGHKKLIDNPGYFKQYEAENGWGTWETFERVVRRYICACKDHPDAKIRACR